MAFNFSDSNLGFGAWRRRVGTLAIRLLELVARRHHLRGGRCAVLHGPPQHAFLSSIPTPLAPNFSAAIMMAKRVFGEAW